MQTGMLMHTLRSFMILSLQRRVLAHEVLQQRSCAKTQCSYDKTMKDLRVCISMPVHSMAGTTDSESEPILCHLAAMTSRASIDVLNAVTNRVWHARVWHARVWQTGSGMLKSATGQQHGQWREPT